MKNYKRVSEKQICEGSLEREGVRRKDVSLSHTAVQVHVIEIFYFYPSQELSVGKML
jgi:hypothetical protein